jgi:hypothetical protein
MIPQLYSPDVNLAYAEAFKLTNASVMKEARKQISEEGIKGKASFWKVQLYNYVTGYMYLLWWSVNKAGYVNTSLEYWKEKYSYTKIKNCLKSWNIDLDLLVNSYFNISTPTTGGLIITIPVVVGVKFFPSDVMAAAGGVLIGQTYALSADNEFGMPEGMEKIRIS